MYQSAKKKMSRGRKNIPKMLSQLSTTYSIPPQHYPSRQAKSRGQPARRCRWPRPGGGEPPLQTLAEEGLAFRQDHLFPSRSWSERVSLRTLPRASSLKQVASKFFCRFRLIQSTWKGWSWTPRWTPDLWCLLPPQFCTAKFGGQARETYRGVV